MWTYGRIEMQFQHLRTPPFDGEDQRREFIRRLNSIPGVAIPEDATMRRRPSFDMAVLISDAHREAFQSVMEWAIAQMRSAPVRPDV
jgi:hypothetical protein